jgi:TetR/AcrR family transcriptional regulator, regulator of cefoperazone and chloramphenicol sensitivity
MPHPTGPAARADATRSALIAAALRIFSRDGFEGASTRDIADAAGTRQALIGYHFGGKQGLYMAVFDAMANDMAERVAAPLAALKAITAAADPSSPVARAQCLAALQGLVRVMVATILREESGDFAQLMLREQQAPGPAFARVYDGFMGEVLETLVALTACLRPDLGDSDCRLTVVTLMGQIMAFRVARAGAMRLLDWSSITPERTEQIAARIVANLGRMLALQDLSS